MTKAVKSCLLFFDHPLALRSYINSGELSRIQKSCSNLSVYSLYDSSSYDQGISNSQIKIVIIRDRLKSIIALNAYVYWKSIENRSISIGHRVAKDRLKERFSLPQRIALSILAGLNLGKPLSWLISRNCFELEEILRKQIDKEVNVAYVTVGGPTSINDILVWLGKKYGLNTITLLENWDNISSKAVFNVVPDRIAVWGAQARFFAEKMHGISSSIVNLTGNPRVEWMRRNVEISSRPEQIAFAGGSIDFQMELNYLKLIKKVLMIQRSKMEMIYLPHPKFYSQCRDQLSVLKDLGVRVLNIKAVENKIAKDAFSLPKFDVYKEFFENAAVVISPLSTMNMEAGILGVPSLGLDFSVQKGDGKRGFVSDSHDHLKDVKNRKMLRMIRNEVEFADVLTDLVKKGKSMENLKMSKDSIDYVYCKEQGLLEILQDMVKH